MPPLRFQRDRRRKQNRSPHPSFASQMPPSPKGEGLWAVKGRPYRTCKRLSGEYRRGRFQTGPPSMGKFPGYGGRGTPQGGLSRPSADSPSASALRDSKKRIQSRNRSALSHRAKLCQTARRGRRALRQNRNRPWFAVGAAALGGPRVFTALFCRKRQISS